MTRDIAKPQKAIKMRSGIVLWVSLETAENIENQLMNPGMQGLEAKFFRLKEANNQMINRVDIEGIYTPEQIADIAHKQKGEWHCDHGNWHGRKDQCDCARQEAIGLRELNSAEAQKEYHKPRTREEQIRDSEAFIRVTRDMIEKGQIDRKKGEGIIKGREELIKKLSIQTG